MSKLISGKEALIALANDQEVEYFDEKLGEWVYMDITHHFKRDFRLKPRTIIINDIEVPAPFEPKLDDVVYYLTTTKNEGYTWGHFHPSDAQMTQFGAWRTESEIKQVVSALRSVFKPQ